MGTAQNEYGLLINSLEPIIVHIFVEPNNVYIIYLIQTIYGDCCGVKQYIPMSMAIAQNLNFANFYN